MNDETTRLLIFDDAKATARAAAERFAEIAGESVRSRGRFSVALSGGSTPRRIYALLAGDEFRARVDWSKAHVFFGDERCVPPDDEASNYRMAQDALLSLVPVPVENVHRMIGEGDAVANARLYEDELRAYFGDVPSPSFDLVMLGLGEDGHAASLFPETPALEERGAWVAANWVEKLGAYRLTLTASVINSAAHVLFVVVGAGKAQCLNEVLNGAREPRRLPAQLIRPVRGTLEWYADRAAAAKLEGGEK
ncbi:MAG: 6-phosphogluconolactonase [Acidobacteria bacterium]|nr:6-phosphogluconolactonase [Acidobacteriota bacterium]